MILHKIILSRGRHKSITTHKLLKDYVVVVPESELKLYSKVINKKDLISIPDEIIGLGAVRNWVLENFNRDIIIMFDDDIKHLINLTRLSPIKITDVETIDQIIQNTVINAIDAECKLFGFSQKGDVRKYRSNEPFQLKTWVGGVVGISRSRNNLQFTVVNKGKVDVDYTLQHLLKFRKVWVDERFCFYQDRDCNIGGSSQFRNSETMKKEMQYLKDKWGKYIRIQFRKTKESIILNVERKQAIKL